MREFIRSVGDGERTVLVSSHILSELEQVCDWLIVIDRGSLVYRGRPRGSLGRGQHRDRTCPGTLGDLERLAALAGRTATSRTPGGELIVSVPEATRG